MKEKANIKHIVVSGLFLLTLFAGMLLHILLPDEALSYSERRALRQFPALSKEALFEGKWTQDLESYLLDQFPGREALRAVKASVLFHVFFQGDSNGIYLQEGHLFKMEYEVDEGSLQRFAQKLNALCAAHMQGKNVYLAVIPDKSQFLAGQWHLSLPYEGMLSAVLEGLDEGIAYIPIREGLALDSYYHTDLHWKQEALGPVAGLLGEGMGFSAQLGDMQAKTYYPFYGGYYGQAAIPGMRPDTLIYLTSPLLERAAVEDFQHQDRHAVYYEAGLGGMDSYDVYLNGATPLITLRDPEASGGRNLLLFRDSYGSSIAPLLLGAYDSITLVDLRYISSALLEQYIDFSQYEDVLFLYGEQMLNNSALLR